MKNFIYDFFRISERRTNLKTEIIGGATTFLTMAYIIFVEPAVLQAAGMDFGAVMTATCIGAAVICILMGLIANYPIAGAPLIGENFFFAFTIVIAMKFPWQAALTAVFIEGLLFLLLTSLRVRELIIDSIPESLKQAMAVAIGLFIGFIGLKWSGLVVSNPSTSVALGDLRSPAVLLSIAGLFITAVLLVKNVKGSFLWGILITTVIGIVIGLIKFEGIVSKPPSIKPVFFKFDFSFMKDFNFWVVVFILLYMEIFDTVGTIIGVAQECGFVKDNKIQDVSKVLFVDSIGTSIGAMLGTSTISSYIESNAGVTQGARTGLANITTGILFLLALLFYPLVKMIGGGVTLSGNNVIYPVIAPTLILVGFLMLKNITRINFSDLSEAIPAYLTIMGVPLTYSIADGIAFGIISYPVIKLLTGRAKEVSVLLYILAGIFILKYAFFHI
ncbi:MAG: NCS2 family permease [Candidatus Goldbacteria bacterium]|nr:NCS2 family permease [Candidatus Goldiibacteriota bacterium]